MVEAFILAVCKDMQSPMNDRLIFVLVSDSYAMSAAMQGYLMKPALSRQS